MRNGKVQSHIEKRYELMEHSESLKSLAESTMWPVVGEGQCFGSLTEINHKHYQAPYRVVAVTNQISCIRLSSRRLRKLLRGSICDENVKLVQRVVSCTEQEYARRILRFSKQRAVSAGSVLVGENSRPKTCYLIRSGLVELTNMSLPLKYDAQLGEPSSQTTIFGLHQGHMSQTFRQFTFAELASGEWAGEDALFLGEQQCHYTVRCKTDCVVLEIAVRDLSSLLHTECKRLLEKIAVRKSLLMLERIHQIADSTKDIYASLGMKQFFDDSLRVLLSVYPSASKKILKRLGEQSQLAGKLQYERNRAV